MEEQIIQPISGRILGSVLALLGLSSSVAAQWGSETLDPKTYRAPAGEYELFVDPSQRSGAGPASYRFTKKGAELWSGTRPWTLWEAQVTDAGLVAGYAYLGGYGGGQNDALVIVLLDPSGKTRLEERSERTGFNGTDTQAKPKVNGFFVDEASTRLLVRISGEWKTGEAWWTYALASGEPELRLFPRSKMGRDEHLGWVRDLRAVPGSSLVLAQWGWDDFYAHRYGAVFTLHDRAGEVLWRLDWPDAYTIAGDPYEQDQVKLEMREHGAILDVSDERFSLRLAAKNERVTFEIRKVEGQREGLDVREVARAPFEAAPEGVAAPDLNSSGSTRKPMELTHLRTIVLGEEAPISAVHDVMDFGLDANGRLGVICGRKEDFEFVLLESDGRVVESVTLPRPAEGKSWSYLTAWVGGDRWAVTTMGSTNDVEQAWWLDSSARTLAPIADLVLPSIESLAGTRDGGFVVLGTTSVRGRGFTYSLLSIGPDGTRRWALSGGQGGTSELSPLFAPAAMTVTSDGRVVVVSGVQEQAHFLSTDGELLRSIDLAAAWGRAPSYVSGVRADSAGGLILFDPDGLPPIVHMDRDDHVTAGFQPRFSDGGHATIRGDVQGAPDGTLWTTDGEALLALDADGVVTRFIGSAPEVGKLGRIATIALGPGDQLYALDERTTVVHVFDAHGVPLHVCRPDPNDFDQWLGAFENLTVNEHGEVLLSRVRFDAAGVRLGRIDEVDGRRDYLKPGGGCWRADLEGLHLVRDDGSVVRTIGRAADGSWLRSIGRVAVAQDGSVAVTDSQGTESSNRVHAFGSAGSPRASSTLPPGVPYWAPFAFDGERLSFGLRDTATGRGSVVLMDLAGHVQRFEPPRASELWTPFFAAGGKELWLFDGERRVEVFALRR